jgi:hypothetical protein
MRYRLCFLALLLLPASEGIGQIIGFPGPGGMPGQYPTGQNPPGTQYPGGGIGGIQLPGRNKRGNTNASNKTPTESVAGMLRAMASDNLVVETSDKRTITVALAKNTKYLKNSSSSAKTSDFEPGDQIAIDATRDDQNMFHAVNVTLVRKGTPDERAAASQAADVSPLSASNGSSGDDDRPKLHRADSDAKTSDTKGQATQRTTAQGSEPEPAVAQPATVADTLAGAAPPPAPRDPDDPGPPQLRRGAPPRASSAGSSPQSAPVVMAQNRPSIQAQEANGVTVRPEAPKVAEASAAQANGTGQTSAGDVVIPSSGDPVIDKTRQEAFSFSDTLPNYVVKQFTTRYATNSAKGGQTSWQPLDNVSADVVYENGKESYKNVLINGKAPKEAVEKTGSWSTGEFASVMQDILSPATDADFHNKRSTTIVNRAAWHYDFSVEQPNSHWHVYASGESYRPEYTGSIWMDKENYRVLRIEMSARNMPKAFPLDTVESAVDYDYVLIADKKFLLPVHSEALSCERGTAICSRNVIDFRNYRKFGADTEITFGSAEK